MGSHQDHAGWASSLYKRATRTFLINENEKWLGCPCIPNHPDGRTITSPPLTNKEGKKRGAGHSTSFHAGWAQDLAGYAGPFGVTETRSNEVCQRDELHAASWSFASILRWTVGHCNGNENEANETSERGSVKLDTG